MAITTVLIVDDSPVLRGFLTTIVNREHDLTAVATAADGEEAVQAVQRHAPRIVLMDIHMPKKNGFEATRQIMELAPTRVLIVTSSWNPDEVATAFEALDAGALALLEKPPGPGHPDSEDAIARLLNTIRTMADVEVVRRRPKRLANYSAMPKQTARHVDVIAIGGSTGAPPVVRALLLELPANLEPPILIAQHIASGFVKGLADWLARTTNRPVKVAEDGEVLMPGVAYVAPERSHIEYVNKHLRARAVAKPNELCPSIGRLFDSVRTANCPIAILLSGMGKDGVAEMKRIREAGGITIAQTEGSAVATSMPWHARESGAAEHVLPPERIAAEVAKICLGAGMGHGLDAALLRNAAAGGENDER
jgi:two-component system chemotaxis response regulator CheB